MIKYTKEVVVEVLLGILLFGIIGCIVILPVWGIRDFILTGYLLGIVLAGACFIHMSITLETSIDMMEENAAKGHAIRAYLIRMIVFVAVMAGAFLSGWFNMLAILAGFFTLKLSVYLRPLTHKGFQHFSRHLDPVCESEEIQGEAVEGQ